MGTLSAAAAAEEQDSPGPRVTVLAPAPVVVVEITEEPTADNEEAGHAAVHVHPGGQGAWVAGMVGALGAQVTVCAPFGGELGEVLSNLLASAGMTVTDVRAGVATGATVVDLRGDEREELAVMTPPALGRHELDDFYGQALVDALESDVLIVTGVDPAGLVPADFFARLVADAKAGNVAVVADLSGEAALAVIEEGATVLKMSHEEMLSTGLSDSEELEALLAAAREVVAQGTSAMVVSRAEAPALLVTRDGAWLASGPQVSPVITSGAGDSMTAGIAVGLGRGLAIADAVRLGAAAGALNVARRGLGSGRREQIERLAEQIEIEPVGDAGSEVA